MKWMNLLQFVSAVSFGRMTELKIIVVSVYVCFYGATQVVKLCVVLIRN